MQDIKVLLDKIIEDARKKADAIIMKAEEQAGDIFDQAQADAGTIWDDMKRKAAEDSGEDRKRIISEAMLRARKQILEAKQELIGRAFEAAAASIKSMDDKRYERFLGDLAVSLASGKNAGIFIAYNDRSRLSASFIEDINARLAKSKGNVLKECSDEEYDINEGFILLQDKYQINASLKSLIETYKELLEADIIKILFRDARKGEKSETVE